MKQVPLYSLRPDEVIELQGKKMVVTPTKTIQKNAGHKYQQIFLKELDGDATLHAPASLMVTKVV